MNILVTGAGGFVGAHLIRLLQDQGEGEIFTWALQEKEAAHIALDAEQIAFVDITNQRQVEEQIQKLAPQQVYHLAAFSSVGLSWKQPAAVCEVNVVGSIHLLEALRRYAPQAKVLLVGSSEQYGKVGQEALPIGEGQPLMGVNPYSVSKMTQERMAKLYVDHYQMHIVLTRSFNHIGTGQSTDFAIPDWCSQVVAIERGEQQPVLSVGNLSVKRDFTDVRDIVSAYTLLMERGVSGEAYNVGSGVAYSLEEILRYIISLSSRQDIRYEVDRARLRPADVAEVRADISKLTAATGWKPAYEIRQSLEDILQSMRDRK